MKIVIKQDIYNTTVNQEKFSCLIAKPKITASIRMLLQSNEVGLYDFDSSLYGFDGQPYGYKTGEKVYD